MKKRNHWNKLDNAAKIFPSATSKQDTKVMRVTCEMNEQTDSAALQCALDNTIKQFPVFQSTLKRGLFWYYLESSTIEPLAREESTTPCSTLYIDKEQLLFEVTYYKNRINLEAHHSLTDGTGAYEFMQNLIMHYLEIKYPQDFCGYEIDAISESSRFEKSDDSFDKYYSMQNVKKRFDDIYTGKVYQIRGNKYYEQQMLIIHGSTNAKEVITKAKEHNATLTEFLCSILICSIYKEMKIRERLKPVIVSIPVNLRKYFPSLSARNFFTVVHAGHHFDILDKDIDENDFFNNGLFDSVLASVKTDLSTKLTKESLQKQIDRLMWAEKNFISRITPLFLKDITLKAIHRNAQQNSTAQISNLGVLQMPDIAKKYIKGIDAVLSTSKIQMVVSSYEGVLTLTISSKFVNTNIQKNFYKILANMGIEIQIKSNQPTV